MADMSAETIQQKIAIARRDAESLKDRIKRKKDELADTTREPLPPLVHTRRQHIDIDSKESKQGDLANFASQFAMSQGNESTRYPG